jgi:hypothetical protein
MPEKALLEKNKELMAALVKLRAEIALAQATLDTAQLYSKSVAERLQRLQSAMEDIRRRTGPESVLALASKNDSAHFAELTEIHEIAVDASSTSEPQGN